MMWGPQVAWFRSRGYVIEVAGPADYTPGPDQRPQGGHNGP